VVDCALQCRGHIQYVHLDVTSEGDWHAAMTRIETGAGGLHVVVNNAGIAGRYGLMETSLEHWDRIFAVNLPGIRHRGTARSAANATQRRWPSSIRDRSG
jgi:NAD(P)-dependent dehydrogenase (short-subunit alcohol dehydrogenase family)